MKLGDLFVQVSTKGVNKVNQGLGQVEKKATIASKAMVMLKGAIMAIGAAVVIRAIKGIIKTFTDYTVQIDKFTKQTGIAADTIQRLVYAAKQEHSSLEALNKGLFNLTVRLGYAGDELETYLRYFRALGIEYKKADGTLRDTYDVFLDIADVTARGKLSTEELAAVTQLFGARAGKELIPLLKKGSYWFKEMGDEAERLGVVLEDKTIKQGKIFSDQMTVMATAMDGMKFALAEEFMPELLELTDNLIVIITKWEEMATAMNVVRNLLLVGIPYLMDELKKGIDDLAVSEEELTGWQKTLNDQMMMMPEILVAAEGPMDDLGVTTEETKKRIKEMTEALSELQTILFLDIDYSEQRTEQERLYNDALREGIELLYGEAEGIRQLTLVESEQTDISQESADVLGVLAGAYRGLNARVLSNADAFQNWAGALVSALTGVIIKLFALAAIIKLLESLGVPAGALLKAGEKIGLFQTPTGDWWAYQEGRDFAKFFFSGVKSRMDSLAGNINNQQQQQTILKIYAEPGIIVEKMADMPMVYKTKFNRDVIERAKLVEE